MSDFAFSRDVEVVMLLASSLHRYEGRPSDGPLPAAEDELRESIEVRAGLGIVGDRYFGQRAHVHASVTVMAAESLDRLGEELGLIEPLDPAGTRRNIILRGVDADALRDTTFALDTGDGPVMFRGNRPANPCAWMNVVLAPGAHKGLRGRGGMRCEPLSSGTLRLGPARLLSSTELPQAPAGIPA